MKFFKDNSYDIVKLFVNQVGITIFSLVLYTAVGFIEDEALFDKVTVGVSVFSILFYFSLLYMATWDLGAKDIIRIEGGKDTRVAFKGGLMSLIANVPNFVLSLGCIISMGIFLMTSLDGAYTVFGVFNLLLRFVNSMYLGLISAIFSFAEADQNLYFLWQSVGYLFFPLLSVAVTHLGYEAGIRNFRIFGFVDKKSKK